MKVLTLFKTIVRKKQKQLKRWFLALIIGFLFSLTLNWDFLWKVLFVNPNADWWAVIASVFTGVITAGALVYSAIQAKNVSEQTRLLKQQIENANTQKAEIQIISKNDELEVSLNNKGDAPIYIHFPILFHIEEHPVTKEIIRHALSNKQIKSETNKLITRGDVCKTHIPTNLLIEMAEKNKHTFFSIYFFVAGKPFSRSFSIVKINDREFELYRAKEMIETINEQEMKRLTCITRHSKSTVSVETFIPSGIGGQINIAMNNHAIDINNYAIDIDALENTKDPS